MSEPLTKRDGTLLTSLVVASVFAVGFTITLVLDAWFHAALNVSVAVIFLSWATAMLEDGLHRQLWDRIADVDEWD